MKKLLAIALCAVMLVGLMAGCSKPADSKATEGSTAAPTETSSEPKQTEEAPKGKLVMATSADYPPYEFHMLDENGNDMIVGIDIDVSKKIAEDMGMELEIVDISFDNLLTSLAKGEADFVLAALEYDETRDKSIDFSEPYYTDLPPMILVKKENVDQFTSIESFDGKVVGAQTGSAKAKVVSEEMPNAELLSLTTVTDLINNLIYNKCTALVLDGAVAKQYAESNPDLVICENIHLRDAVPYRVCVQEGDPKGLLESINKTVTKLASDGTIEKYIENAKALSDYALEG